MLIRAAMLSARAEEWGTARDRAANRDGADRIVFESFGYVAEVVSEDPALLDRVGDVLPPGWRPHRGQPRACFGMMRDGRITLDGEPVRPASVWGNPVPQLASVVHRHLAEHAPDYVFIHAGVVAIGHAAIVIPGSSMSGKSTLVGELVRAGASYYSDEYAVVDACGMIHAYPKPLSLRADPSTGAFVGSVEVPKDRIGREPVRPGVIVVTRYEEGARWQPRELTAAEGALALLEHTVVARSRPGESIAAVRRIAEDARTISGPRGEAGLVAGKLLRIAERSAPECGSTSLHGRGRI